MNTRQEMLNVLALKRAEQQACFGFAIHLSHCDLCRTSGHGRIGSAGNLCQSGRDARDKSIAAARAYAQVDQDFARRYAQLVRS